MKAATLYRTSAVLLVLFAVGHTIGFLTFKPPTQEALALRDAMTNVHFDVNGSQLSYGGFYRGFGLFVTAYLLFAALLAWRLATNPDPMVAWSLCATQMVSLVLGWIYFSAPPAILSAMVAGCVGYAASKTR